MYKSPSFQIAEARGTLDELCAMNPGAIADRIRQTDQEIEGDYPEEIGSVDEVYDNLKEKIGALARKEGEPEKTASRDLAMMTALSKIKAASGAGQRARTEPAGACSRTVRKN